MGQDTSFELSCFLTDQVDIKNSYTPKDLDEESYGLTRSPTAKEIQEFSADLLINLKAECADNHAGLVGYSVMNLLKKLTKGCK